MSGESLNLSNISILTRQKSLLSPKNFFHLTFQRLGNNVHSKGKFNIPPVVSGCEVLLSASNKATILTVQFSESFNVNGTPDFNCVFLPGTNLRL